LPRDSLLNIYKAYVMLDLTLDYGDIIYDYNTVVLKHRMRQNDP